MGERKKNWTPPPATTPEIREQQLTVLATDLAEQQLREGVASSAVIVHYLKLAGEKSRLENEKLKAENEVLKAKAEAIESAKRSDAKYEEAIAAFRSYSGMGDVYEDGFDDY